MDAGRVIGHKEWAPRRKSDPTYSMGWRRARVAAFVPGWPIAGQVEDDDMATIGPGSSANVVRLVQQCLVNEAKASGRLGGNPLPKFGIDGDYGDETKWAVHQYQLGKVPATGLVDGVTAALLFRWENRTA